MNNLQIVRGSIWLVRFDPSEGDEIQKIRPAVVVTNPSAGKMDLQIVAPITGWQSHFFDYFWMVPLIPTPLNGLSKDSAVDAFQVKSLSTLRFQRKLGSVTVDELNKITNSIMLCIGYKPK